MCGIFGWQFTDEGIKGDGSLAVLATSLIQSNEARGQDSWGFVRQEADGSLKVIKAVGCITLRLYLKSILRPQIMGHTRQASSGAVTTENAHPFTINGLVGAHNGIINNDHELETEHKWKYTVDSQYLLRYIADGLPLTKIRGSGTVEYILTNEPGTVYLAKGPMGSLAIAGIGRSKHDTVGIVWSSSQLDLERALELSGYKYFLFRPKDNRQFKIVDGKLSKNGRFELSADVNIIPNLKGGVREYCRSQRSACDPWPIGSDLANLPETLDYYRSGYYWSSSKGKYIRHDVWDASEDGRSGYRPPTSALTLQGDEREEQCEGCLEWGMPVEPPQQDGIRMYPTIGRRLCRECGSIWGQEVGGGMC